MAITQKYVTQVLMFTLIRGFSHNLLLVKLTRKSHRKKG